MKPKPIGQEPGPGAWFNRCGFENFPYGNQSLHTPSN
jgi:hypothetical protein